MERKINQVVNLCHTLHEKFQTNFPKSFEEAAERIHFTRHGHGQADHEMSSFRTFDKPPENIVGTSYTEFGEADEYETGKMNGMIGEGPIGEFTGEGDRRIGKISEWQAGWNVTNAIQGMFIVSLPYAVLHGGYWGVFSLVFVAYICCYTGKILVACLYETNEKGDLVRVRDSYVAVAETCLGEKYGGTLVNTAQIIELLMTCILYVVLCGDLLIGSFPEGIIDQRSWMMICAMLLLPCAFLTDLRSVSTLSFWCTITHIIINVFIFAYCFTQIGDWQWSKVTFRLDFQTFPITLGIVVFSYTSHIFLPSLEGNMKDNSQFHDMLDWSHIAAGTFKALFAYIGFLTWGDQTQEVITNNLPTKGFKTLTNLTLVVKALLSYPLPYFAAASLLESAFFRSKPTDERPDGEGPQYFPTCWTRDIELRVWAVALRVLLVLFTLFMAVSIPHFALLMGLIGNFTGAMLSFVWPCYFHMKIKWNEMELKTIIWEVFIICTGLICGVIGIFTSFTALVEAYHLPLPYPGQYPVRG